MNEKQYAPLSDSDSVEDCYLSAEIDYEYDERGMCKTETKNIHYTNGESVTEWTDWQYEYDDKEQMIKKTKQISQMDTDNIEFKYEYDDKGNRIKETTYHNGIVISVCGYEYDNAGKEIKEIEYGAPDYDTVYCIYEIERNSDGKMMWRIQMAPDGTIIHREEYEYTKFGKISKLIGHESNGSITAWTEYIYDDNEHCIESRRMNEEGILGRTENEYDDNDNRVKITDYDENGSVRYYEEMEYAYITVK